MSCHDKFKSTFRNRINRGKHTNLQYIHCIEFLSVEYQNCEFRTITVCVILLFTLKNAGSLIYSELLLVLTFNNFWARRRNIASYRRNNSRRIIAMLLSSRLSIATSRTTTSVSWIMVIIMPPSFSTATSGTIAFKMTIVRTRTIFPVHTSMLWVVSY